MSKRIDELVNLRKTLDMKPDELLKIKVFKIKKERGGCYECGYTEEFARGVTKWDEISRKDYSALENAVMYANNNLEYHYFIIFQQEDYQEIFDSAAEYIAYQKKQAELQEIRDKKDKERREHLKIERKQKQLAKLKKELEEAK